MDSTTNAIRPRERVEVYEADADKVEAIVDLVIGGFDSPNTRRNYARAIRDFMAWYRETGQIGLGRPVVLRYRAQLLAGGMGAASVNQRLSAIRKLAGEAADNDVLNRTAAMGIQNVKGVKQRGTRQGFWLSREQAQRLLDAPDTDTLKGSGPGPAGRDARLCLRRRKWPADVRPRPGAERRWLIVDLVGKGRRTVRW